MNLDATMSCKFFKFFLCISINMENSMAKIMLDMS